MIDRLGATPGRFFIEPEMEDMLNTFTVSLFGHREINWLNYIEEKLEEIVRGLISTNEYVEFLIGREGDFDTIAASVIRRVVKKCGFNNSSLVLVLPYAKAEVYRNEKYFYGYYDEIEVCPESERAFFKAAIQTRNRAMIDRSDLAVFYVEKENGGAFQTMQYAVSKGCGIINIAKMK